MQQQGSKYELWLILYSYEKHKETNVETGVANKTYRNAGQTRTLADVVAVVPGWAMSAGDRNRIAAVAVLASIAT